jgi:predicted S18 family serine protease
MGTPESSSLKALAEDVKRALVGLPANLRRSLYKDNAVKSLSTPVAKLDDMIQKELSRDPYYANKSAVRSALSSLRKVQGTIQLLMTASAEYATSRTLAEKHENQETWIDRRNRLMDQADLCAESLEVVLAFADDLESPESTSEPRGETKEESNLPDNTTAGEPRGQASQR